MALERYRKVGVRLADIPTTDLIGAREAVRTAGALAQSMDRVTRFAQSKAQEEYQQKVIQRQARTQREAQEMVAERGAQTVLKEIMAAGGPEQSEYMQAAYEAANKIAISEVETQAINGMNQILTDAELNQTDYETVEQQLDDLSLGFASSVESIDPVSAGLLKQRLDNKTLNAKNKYAIAWDKKTQADLQGTALLGIDARKTEALSIMATDNPERDVLFEEQVQNLAEFMRDRGFDEADISKQMLRLRKQGTVDSTLYDFNQQETLADKKAFAQGVIEKPPAGFTYEEGRQLSRTLMAEVAAAERAQESQITAITKAISGETDSAMSVLTKGGDPGEAKINELRAQSAKLGSPVELEQEIAELEVMRAAILPMRKMPPLTLQTEINVMRQGIEGMGGKGVDTEMEVKILESAEKLLTNIKTQAKDDPLSLAAEVGHIDFKPLNFNDLDSLAQSITDRGEDAVRVAGIYGVEPKYLTDEEATMLGQRIDQMTPAEKAQFAIQMTNAPNTLFGQLTSKGANVFSMASAIGDPVISAKIFEGQELIKGKTVVMPSRNEAIEAADNIIGDVYGAEDRKTVIDSALAHYAATTTTPDKFDKDDFENSVNAVTGGIGEVNGGLVELPRGIDGDDFESFMDRFPANLVTHFGGVQGASAQEAAEYIQERKVKSIGTGKYIVLHDNGVPLMREDGQPFVITWGGDEVNQAYSLLTGKIL